MKKSIRIILSIVLTLILGAGALAETVYVTITDDQGRIPVAHEAVELKDADGDGSLTINDALILAHEAFYEGGAAAGFATEDTQYGISMLKLWGIENGGSYGYYVNDASAMSLSDVLSEGDALHAYAFQDLEGWSDVYSCFQTGTAEVKVGDGISLTLTAQMFDADWNLVPTLVEGAVITINGADSALVTDANGTCSISFAEPGKYVVSARSDSMTLVPPVCVVTVSE